MSGNSEERGRPIAGCGHSGHAPPTPLAAVLILKWLNNVINADLHMNGVGEQGMNEQVLTDESSEICYTVGSSSMCVFMKLGDQNKIQNCEAVLSDQHFKCQTQ